MGRVVRRRGGVVGVAQRRQTLWAFSADESGFTDVVGSGVDFQSSLNAAALALRPFTIIRTVGYLAMISDQVAASEQPFGAWGVAVVSDQAVAAGVAALPSPITDEGSDLWLAYQGLAAPMVAGPAMPGPSIVQFDSRGQRKVEEGQDIVSMFENASVVGLRYVVKYRFLLKLH